MIDPFSAEFRKNLYANYSLFRERDPVQYFPERNLWAVSRYKDVLDVLKNPGIFSSTGRKVEPSLIGADPPAHTRVRRIVSRFQKLTSSRDFEKVIRNLVEELVNNILPRRSF